MGCEVNTTWRTEPDGSRTCAYCGSLHPEDFTDIMWRYSQREEGYSFDRSTKNYKDYGHRPGVQNAMQGGIKFYGNHCVTPWVDELYAARELALARYRADIAEKWGPSAPAQMGL